MRIAIISAKTEDGQWVTLAQPDVSISKQKVYFKDLKKSGGVIELNGKAVKLDEAHLFVSGSGKRIKFKGEQAGKPAPQDNGVKNLDQLAAALEIDRKELDAVRKLDGFPGEKDEAGCFDVEAVKALIEALGEE